MPIQEVYSKSIRAGYIADLTYYADQTEAAGPTWTSGVTVDIVTITKTNLKKHGRIRYVTVSIDAKGISSAGTIQFWLNNAADPNSAASQVVDGTYQTYVFTYLITDWSADITFQARFARTSGAGTSCGHKNEAVTVGREIA